MIIAVIFLATDAEYEKLIDSAFKSMPNLSEENIDFRIPEADSIVQGSKTLLRNFSQIAEVARRDKKELMNYLTKELGAHLILDEGRLVISGKVNAEELNLKIKKFFEMYVICKECNKPDTHTESVERGFATIVCEACGARYSVKYY